MSIEKLTTSVDTLSRNESYTVKTGDGISALSTNLGIRESYLKGLQNIQTPRIGDTFELSVDKNGNGTLIHSRNSPNGVSNVLSNPPISREAIYQNIEFDSSFPNIAYIRIPSTQSYHLVYNDTPVPKGENFTIGSNNLDAFKKELEKISGAFVTECESRAAQADLMCSIKPVQGFENSFQLNSKRLFDFIPTNISMDRLVLLLSRKSSQNSGDLARILAQSLSLNPPK